MLFGREVPRVAQVIGDIELHEGCAHAAALRMDAA